MRIHPFERGLLRERALEQWHWTKELLHDADESCRRRPALRRTHDERVEADAARAGAEVALSRARQLVEETTVLRSRTPVSTSMVRNADQAIEALCAPLVDMHDMDGGAALIASANMAQLMQLRDLVATKVPYVQGASNAGTALGMGIVLQPEVAVIDSVLGLVDGAELALMLRLVAPQTRILVLTDDARQAEEHQGLGLDTRRRNIGDKTLLGWVATAA